MIGGNFPGGNFPGGNVPKTAAFFGNMVGFMSNITTTTELEILT